MQYVQLTASQIVQQVLVDGRNLNQVLAEAMRDNDSLLPAQRAAVQDLSYGTLRFYGQLQQVLNMLLHKPLVDKRLRYLLLVALFQLQYSKSAPHTIVDQAVRAAQALSPRVGGLVNAILRNFLRNQTLLLEQAAEHDEGKYNHLEWWIKQLQSQYGTLSAAILAAGNQHPPMTLRVNQQLISAADYLKLLEQQNIAAQEINAEWFRHGALKLEKPMAVGKLPGFVEGLVSVQDAGAQYAATLLDVQNGMRVLDACAAPGGKTAHMLERATLTLVAVDKDEKRMQQVADNLRRLKLSAKLLVGDATKPEQWWDGVPFQRILADVPCSASGVVRRHPDIKWLRRKTDIAGFATQQGSMLRALWQLLAHGGKLLYSTCSVFQQENEQVIAAFLEHTSDAQRLPITLADDHDGQLLPNDQHDGFFYALLQKID